MASSAQMVEGLAGGQRVAVQQDNGVAAGPFAAAIKLVLPPGAMANEVGERAVLLGHAGVVFLDPAPHLRDQLRLEAGNAAMRPGRVGVLVFEVGPDIGWQAVGIAKHVVPVLRLEPGIIVLQPLPVDRGDGRANRRYRRDAGGGGFVGHRLGYRLDHRGTKPYPKRMGTHHPRCRKVASCKGFAHRFPWPGTASMAAAAAASMARRMSSPPVPSSGLSSRECRLGISASFLASSHPAASVWPAGIPCKCSVRSFDYLRKHKMSVNDDYNLEERKQCVFLFIAPVHIPM